MSFSKNNIESLVRQAEAILQNVGHGRHDSSRVRDLIADIQTAMTESKAVRRTLGPLLGKLRDAQNRPAALPINWIPLFEGHLAIGHRPKIKWIRNMQKLGANRVLTLLSESEGAAIIGKEVRDAGLDWIWLPLTSAGPPSQTRRIEIEQTFDDLQSALNCHACVYVHCSAGIHRTGMITYAFLR